ncbi:MAG: M3 family metallopeptidase [Bacteroidaceae bacterium]|nr:M3 family metallopeptidase [Bacteroidaceae bacterium]
MNNKDNPFFSNPATPHATFPFGEITPAHLEEAILRGMDEERSEVERIATCPDAPTFENTIVALEHSGQLLRQADTVLGNLFSACTNDAIDDLCERMSPVMARHHTELALDARVFQRVKAVHDAGSLDDEEDAMLLRETYEGYVRAGALLDDTGKARLKAINEELAQLTMRFSQNRLKATNAYAMWLKEDNLEGLPDDVKARAAEAARQKGREGWLFTLAAPSYGPFMMYSRRSDLREQMYMAYQTLCVAEGPTCNLDIVPRLVNLRLERARLLGYKNHAEYALARRMAARPAAVYGLLNSLIEGYRPAAETELADIRDKARRMEGEGFELKPWDFAYYSRELKQERFDLDPEMLRPYFELSRVKQGVFGLAQRLYGIRLQRNEKIPVYHPDVEAYDVFDTDGTFLAVFYYDPFPRANKQSGAWMTVYQDQYRDANGDHRPQVAVVTNFTPPAAGKPSLLTLSEVETLLHEFGHALHGIFAATRYASLSGTNVYWDFVELPSQFMENYAVEPEFLNTFARHHVTGEPIPADLVERIRAARNFGVAYACIRQVSFGLLDMAWYDRTEPFPEDADTKRSVQAFEAKAWAPAQLLPPPEGCCMTAQFSHIMTGGYSAGYYSYKWAEVLDADAFAAFREEGLFNPQTAKRFRDCVLSKGGTRHPAELYRAFRGQDPTIEALMRRDGILPAT